MPVINSIAALHPEMTAWRRDLHAHPLHGVGQRLNGEERLLTVSCPAQPDNQAVAYELVITNTFDVRNIAQHNFAVRLASACQRSERQHQQAKAGATVEEAAVS